MHVSTSAFFRTNQNMDAILHFPRFFDRFWGNFFTCWNFWLSFDTFFFCHLGSNVSYIVFIFTWLGLPKWQTVVPGQKGLVLRVAYLISLFRSVLCNYGSSRLAKRLKCLPVMQETWCSIPGLGRSPGEGNGNPLQYFCLENPMDGEAWWAIVHVGAKSQTRLSDLTF